MEGSFLESIPLSSESVKYFWELLIVIGIGALLGLEREFSKNANSDRSIFAGIRTYPMVTILAYLSTLLANQYGIWILIVVTGGVFFLTGLAYFNSSSKGEIGGTSEFSLMVAFILGCLVFYGEYLLAATTAVFVTFILVVKIKLHSAVHKLSRDEIYSILFFIILSALMLPILPDKAYGWYGVFNPYKIWLIVVIFISLNFVAYFISKFIETDRSILAIGVLGGFASSTATAWYFARQSKGHEDSGIIQAAAVVLASSIMFPRILVWLFILNQDLFLAALTPGLVLAVAGIGAGIWISRRNPEDKTDYSKTMKNPINLKEALIFGALYIGIQFLVGFADEQLGDRGLYLASAISGITDVDAITVSLANYEKSDTITAVALVSLIIAALMNTLVKYGLCVFLGNSQLRKYSTYGFLPIVVVGIAFIIYYLVF